MKRLVLLPLLIVFIFLFSGCALVDLTGSWFGTVTFAGGDCSGSTISFTLDILQDGEAVSGTLSFDGYDYSFSGTVSGADFTIDGEMISEDPWQSLELDGIAVGDSSASGTFVQFGEINCSGTFSIERGVPVSQ